MPPAIRGCKRQGRLRPRVNFLTGRCQAGQGRPQTRTPEPQSTVSVEHDSVQPAPPHLKRHPEDEVVEHVMAHPPSHSRSHSLVPAQLMLQPSPQNDVHGPSSEHVISQSDPQAVVHAAEPEHVCWHEPAWQSRLQCVSPEHDCSQDPPPHASEQVASVVHSCTQWPPSQSREHVLVPAQSRLQLPSSQPRLQSPAVQGAHTPPGQSGVVSAKHEVASAGTAAITSARALACWTRSDARSMRCFVIAAPPWRHSITGPRPRQETAAIDP